MPEFHSDVFTGGFDMKVLMHRLDSSLQDQVFRFEGLGLGFRFEGLGFRIDGLGLGFRVQCVGSDASPRLLSSRPVVEVLGFYLFIYKHTYGPYVYIHIRAPP